MKIAIVVGVAEYNSLGSLPACQNDAESIRILLEGTGEFDVALFLTGNVTGRQINKSLSEAVSKYSASDVDEVFFYFSGHGEFIDGEFRFLMSDFTAKQRNQTSLTNTHLDDVLRSLSPNIFCKVVDACQSGTRYIKDSDAFDRYLKGSAQSTPIGTLNSVYFMFSSMSTESSYADVDYSYFTRSFLSAAVPYSGDVILYKNFIDHIADDAELNKFQTPYFVTQGRQIDSFGVVSADAVKRFFAASTPTESAAGGKETKVPPLLERVQVAANSYATQEEAFAALEGLREELLAISLPEPCQDLFNVHVSFESGRCKDVNTTDIANWLDEEGDDYLARVKYRNVNRRIRNPTMKLFGGSMMGLTGMFRNEEDEYITVTDKVVDSYLSTISMPFDFARIDFSPKYPSIEACVYFVFPVLSFTHLRLFFAQARIKRTDWVSTEVQEPSEWSTRVVALKPTGNSRNLTKNLVNHWTNSIQKQVLEKFPPQPNSE